MITQDELKELLHYDPETGVFTWKVNRGNQVNDGFVAGNMDGDGHLQISINKKKYKAHRLAWLYMTGKWPKEHIDHINGVKDDNKFFNLREATNQENCINRGKGKNNTSGYKGVSWNSGQKKWQANARLNYKLRHLGYFNTAEEAFESYKAFAIKHQGEFINLG
jgi:hypothetical protein